MADYSEDIYCGGQRHDDRKAFRHCCQTKYLASLNKKLSVEQRCLLEGTPFGWFTMLTTSLKISRRLLRSLIRLWVENRGGFLISNEVVQFSLLDVCMELGLRVDGKPIDLDEVGGDSKCRKFFDNKTVHVKMVYDLLKSRSEEVTVEDFCRLYILLGISEFLCANASGRVFPILFTIVDDLDSLGKYTWGVLVYEYLVGSISNASMFLLEEGNSRHFHVLGCVYLLQLWSFDHFLIPKSKFGKSTTKFPRILQWKDMKVTEDKISSALNNNMVVIDVGVSKFELCQPFVKEAFEKYGTGFEVDSEDDEQLTTVVDKQKAGILELK